MYYVIFVYSTHLSWRYWYNSEPASVSINCQVIKTVGKVKPWYVKTALFTSEYEDGIVDNATSAMYWTMKRIATRELD